MAEKWMQKKMNMPRSDSSVDKQHSNPYSIKQPNPPFRGPACRYGMPAQLFADSDKDCVSNVFDCKPHDKRKQDVLAPMGGGNPMQEMLSRQEGARQQHVYMRSQEEYQRLLQLQQQKFLNQQAAAQRPIIKNVYQIEKVYYGGTGGGSSSKSGGGGTSKVATGDKFQTCKVVQKTPSIAQPGGKLGVPKLKFYNP